MGKLSVFRSPRVMIGLSGAVLMVVLAGLLLVNLRDALLSDRTELLTKTVREAYVQVVNYHQLATNGDMTTDEAQKAALEALRQSRHSDNEYFWVTDYEGRLTMHPILPALEGELLSTMDDVSDLPLHDQISNILRVQGKGFVSYSWPKPGSDEAVGKISYVVGFAPWGWGIGSGVYIDDIDRAFWVEVQTLGVVLSVLLAVLLAFWFGFHKVLFPKESYTNILGKEVRQ